MNYTVLIVDDEPNAREYLKHLLSTQSSANLIGECSTGNEAIAFCETLQPDIIFLDIQMPGKNGLETAQRILSKGKASIIIFTTAFDQYAIQAFEVEALGYLLKPFSEDQFKKSLKRAMDICDAQKKSTYRDRIGSLVERIAKPSTHTIDEFIIYERGLETNVSIKEILYINSDSEYVTIHTISKKYLKRLSLKILERQLPKQFLRIHRSSIINMKMVKDWKYLNNGTYQFLFENGNVVTSSRSYGERIKEILSN
ncbi:MAG: response regulator transcription factor [Cyclobacteriaceae bacterium]